MTSRLMVGCLSAFLVLESVPAYAAMIDISSGVLTVAGGGLSSGPGGWTQASLSYDVNFDTVADHYIYAYAFDGITPNKDVSHVITQVSSNFTTADIRPGTTALGPDDGLDTYGTSGSNPGIPGSIYGIKWNPSANSSLFSWAIVTTRAPMWGNTYIVDGKKKFEEVYSYNSGFGTTPSCYNALYYTFSSCTGFLLVPDSVTRPPELETPVPEPMSLVLFGTGLAGVAAAARRRRSQRGDGPARS